MFTSFAAPAPRSRSPRFGRWPGAVAAVLLGLVHGSVSAGQGLHSHVPTAKFEPERVVALEFLETEVALALQLPIVGMADKAGYGRWVGVRTEALQDVVSVGGRAEPSLEQIIRLEPDLIVGSTWRHGGVARRLEALAPLVLYRDLPEPDGSDQFSRMREIVRDLAARTGREARGKAVLDNLDEHLEHGRERIEAAGLAGASVAFAQVVEGQDRLRLFTDNSLVVQVMQRLGLRNGWQAPPGDYGYQPVDIGALRRLSAEVHIALSAADESESYRALTGHPAWPELAPVEASRVHRLERELWPFGGPYSAMRIADRLVETLTGKPITTARPYADGASAAK